MTNDTGTTPIGLLTGKVVFITGASRGIGAAAARLFAREGAAVVLAARSAGALDRVVEEVRAGGGVADAVGLDLADRASIRAAVGRVEELHGRLDGAFNNGAAIQQPGPLDTTSDEDIEGQFAVNFRAGISGVRPHVPDHHVRVPALGVQVRASIVLGHAPQPVSLVPPRGPGQVIAQERGDPRGGVRGREPGHPGLPAERSASSDSTALRWANMGTQAVEPGRARARDASRSRLVRLARNRRLTR